MSREHRAPTKAVIEAHEVVAGIFEVNGPTYILRDRSISGKLDLKHRTVKIAVYIQDCEFLDEVDLRSCEFEQAVNFSECIFRECFDSGDEIESHTVFRKDLNCSGATFEGTFALKSGRIEGSAYFSRARFLDEKEPALFALTSVEGTLDLEKSFFKGWANFNSLKCGTSGLFSPSTFEKGADFRNASFGRSLDCAGAVFGGPAFFRELECGNLGLFNNAAFEEEADFGYASFGRHLQCQCVTFRKTANFSSLKCDSGFFDGATFKGEADFGHASFGKNLQCRGALFGKRASFSSLKCGNSGVFRPLSRQSIFEGEANFSFASFGVNLECQGAIFRKKASFSGLECAAGFFGSATFQGEVDFRLASFNVALYCRESRFASPVDLSAAHMLQVLDLDAAHFEQEVRLYRIKIGVLRVGKTLPFGDKSYADLRECNFNAFDGDREIARRLAARQNPDQYSRDPYLQLEKYYRGVGDEIEAKRIYYLGRGETRKNARKRGGRTRWSRLTLLRDVALWGLTGYGVQTWRLLIPILLFLGVGTFVFWPSEALVRSPGTQSASNEALVSEVNSAPNRPGRQQSLGDLGQHLFERASYSLDLFLPVVNLPIGENWQPSGLGRQIYANFHLMVGWILVPLLLASLAGIIRRE